jgi:hypothetical protein
MEGAEDYLTAVAFAADAVAGHAAAIHAGREPDPDGDRIDQWINHYAGATGTSPDDIRTALNH